MNPALLVAIIAANTKRPPEPVPDLVFITNLPGSLSVDQGTRLTLSVAVEGGREPYSYAWTVNGNAAPGNTNTSSISYGNASSAHAGSWRCVVTSDDVQSVESDVCAVDVVEPEPEEDENGGL